MREVSLRKQPANLDRITGGYRLRDPDAGPGWWRMGARCAEPGRDVDLWFTESRTERWRGVPELVGAERYAVALCSGCKVQAECLRDSLRPMPLAAGWAAKDSTPTVPTGIWGGTLPSERAGYTEDRAAELFRWAVDRAVREGLAPPERRQVAG
jgi:hypothetical protein